MPQSTHDICRKEMQSHSHFRENKLANRGLRPVTSRLNAPGSWSTEVPSSKDSDVGRGAEIAVLPQELGA